MSTKSDSAWVLVRVALQIAAGEGEAVPGYDRILYALPLRQRLSGLDSFQSL
jgi:hypothetical protein